MKKRYLILAIALIISTFINLSAQTDSVNVTFKVDMSVQKQLGNFKPDAPDNHKILLKGTFNNGWEICEMTPFSDSPDIYETTLRLIQNSISPFKFFIQTDPSDENIGIWEKIPGNHGSNGDRTMVVRSSDIEISPLYFDNLYRDRFIINSFNDDPNGGQDPFYFLWATEGSTGSVNFNPSGVNRGSHQFDYSILQTAEWGGNAGVSVGTKGLNFLDLSKAGATNNSNTLSFYINIDSKPTLSDRAQIYISLWEMSENPGIEFDGSLAECWEYTLDINTLYAEPGWNKIEIPITNFSIPNWIMYKGNDNLDLSKIRQYDIGLMITGREGGIGSDVVSGSFRLDNFAAEYIPDHIPVSIHFKVDMKGVNQQFKFDPAKDHVFVRGGFNFWTLQDTLRDPDGDLVYEGYALALSNGFYEYKFFTDSPTADNTGWESNVGSVDTLNGNRTIYVGSTDIQVPLIYFDEIRSNLYTWSNFISLVGESNTISMLFGTSPSATDGQDLSLGEIIAPPPPPESDAPDLKFHKAGYEDLINDFRADNQDAISWQIIFQGAYPLKLMWDKNSFPEGSFKLVDAVGGSFINIDMKNIDSVVITNDAITKLNIIYNKSISKSINIAAGWNIASVPLNTADMSASSIFADNITSTWKYDAGYRAETTLEAGKGYWVKYVSAKTIDIVGLPVNKNTVPVKSGWNIIGPYENDIPIANITTTPAGIIKSTFFSFESGYKMPVSLKPGMGYWIKVDADGVLNLNSGVSKISESNIAKIDNNWSKIIVSDSKHSFNLYLADKVTNTTQYELPPLSPSGDLDVRFDSQTFVEVLGSSAKRIIFRSEDYPVTINLYGTDLRIRTNDGIETILRNGEKFTITNPAIRSIEIEPIEMPLEFTLMQNYPNPFNPSTTIKFGLPEKSNVNISIFNTLGEKVDELINGEMEAGYHTINWKPSALTSGIYIYRITTNKYMATKKLIFLK